MEIDATNCSLHLVEADEVEALEACARYAADSMVRDEKVLLPSHEEMFSLRIIAVAESVLLRLFGQWTPSGKAVPMLHINFNIGAPLRMTGLKGVLVPDNLAFKIRSQGRVLVREPWKMPVSDDDCSSLPHLLTFDAQVSAEKRLAHVDML